MGRKKQSAQRRARETGVSQRPVRPPREKTSAHLSTTAALLTAEILESILLELDQATLLTSAQRVCRTWHRSVATSPRLQRHLFFEPDLEHEQQEQEPRQNPLLRRLLGPDLFFAEPRVLPPDHFTNGLTDWAPHPMVRVCRYAPQDAVKMRLPIMDVGPGRRGMQAAFACEGASWRRMLPSQPASTVGQLLHFVDPLWYDERDHVGGGVGKATYFGRVKWQSSFRHRLCPTAAAATTATTTTICRRGDVGSEKQQDYLRMGELYDAMYYILWGSDMPNGCINQACAVLLRDKVQEVMSSTASETVAGSTIGDHQHLPQQQPQQEAVGRGGGFQWAIFSSLACGRGVPGSLPRKEEMAAAGRSASISAEPQEWVRKRLARRQRERRSYEWMFRSAEYDEERTKVFLRLQSPRDKL